MIYTSIRMTRFAQYSMSEEITTPEQLARRKYLNYLNALYSLGMHETMRMMKDGEYVYDRCINPTLKWLKFY